MLVQLPVYIGLCSLLHLCSPLCICLVCGCVSVWFRFFGFAVVLENQISLLTRQSCFCTTCLLRFHMFRRLLFIACNCNTNVRVMDHCLCVCPFAVLSIKCHGTHAAKPTAEGLGSVYHALRITESLSVKTIIIIGSMEAPC